MPKYLAFAIGEFEMAGLVWHFENGWTVQVTSHSTHCAGFVSVPTHIYDGHPDTLAGYCEAFAADPKNVDTAHNTDTELIQVLAGIAARPAIGPVKEHADEVAEMIKKACKK